MDNNILNSTYVIGIDIGGTNFRIGGITNNGSLIDKPFIYKSRELFVEETSSAAIKIINEIINKFISSYPNYKLKGICIGLPGTVDANRKVVISCPLLPAMNNLNLAGILEKIFKVPVIIEHDVIVLLNFDLKRYELVNLGVVLGIYVGTGLGNAIYIDGKFLKGKNGVAGELGHIPLKNKIEKCPCGNTGCIEIYSSGIALERIYREHFFDIEFKDIFNNFDDSDYLKEFIDYLAVAISTEVNILDPDCIVLGGGVVHMQCFPYNYLLKRIYFYSRKPYPAVDLRFIISSNDNAMGVQGAGIYFWDMIN